MDNMVLVLVVALYAFFSYCLLVIARKTDTDGGWMAWVPVLQLYLMCKVAHLSGWMMLLMFVPIVNVVFAVVLMMKIAEATQKPSWVGVLTVVPVVGMFVLPYLAFSN